MCRNWPITFPGVISYSKNISFNSLAAKTKLQYNFCTHKINAFKLHSVKFFKENLNETIYVRRSFYSSFHVLEKTAWILMRCLSSFDIFSHNASELNMHIHGRIVNGMNSLVLLTFYDYLAC